MVIYIYIYIQVTRSWFPWTRRHRSFRSSNSRRFPLFPFVANRRVPLARKFSWFPSAKWLSSFISIGLTFQFARRRSRSTTKIGVHAIRLKISFDRLTLSCLFTQITNTFGIPADRAYVSAEHRWHRVERSDSSDFWTLARHVFEKTSRVKRCCTKDEACFDKNLSFYSSSSTMYPNVEYRLGSWWENRAIRFW